MYVAVLIGMTFCGILLLLLALGYRSIEEERRREDERQAERRHRALEPRFFAAEQDYSGRPRFDEAVAVSNADLDSLVVEVERFLRLEYLLAERFLDQPSIANLHTRTHKACWARTSTSVASRSNTSPDTLVGDVERHLRREQFLVDLFLVQPSFSNLHRRTQRACLTN